MPSAPGARRQVVVDACQAKGIPVRTLPGPKELLGADSLVTRLRDVQVEDLLGRQPVRLDLAEIGAYVTGRSVLVTGAGGSIGSELVRQIGRLGPTSLVLIDNSETNLFTIERELADRGVAGVIPVLADVKDSQRMRALLDTHAPQVVFHAAAYKHVPVMEQNPLEAIRNNTLATRDLATIAREAGVERFVLISTDKAVNPQTVMGASKALCEWVVEAAAQAESDTRFIAVRFGNVLASSGSVIPIFREQIAAGGPVTVTDARMTRYFMTIPEAAQLVIEAGGVGESGDIFVLDMGEPVSIMQLARDMVRLSGKTVEIRVTGIRPGEKLDEELFEGDEAVERTRHEKLQVARRGQIDVHWLSERLRCSRRACWPATPTGCGGRARDGAQPGARDAGPRPRDGRRLMDTRQLAALVAVVDRASFSQAAEQLGVTQPAVSLAIRALEKRLGATLLDRSGRTVQPTEVGRAAYRHAQRILAAEEDLFRALDEGATDVAGQLSLGSSAGAAERLLPAILGRFREQHPEVGVALRVDDTDSVIALVVDRQIELGIVGAERPHRSLLFEPFLRDEVVLLRAGRPPVRRSRRVAGRAARARRWWCSRRARACGP